MDKKIIRFFDKPKIIGVLGDVNTGKSMLLYNIIELLNKEHKYKLFYYGLRLDLEIKDFLECQRVFSVTELESVRDSIIIIDELSSLFDLDNRKIKKQIENSLRLLNHNNNVIILCGTPENFKKFLSGKLDIILFKKVTLADCINGSRVKNILLGYKGYEMGSELLNIPVNKVLVYDGSHYGVESVDYLKHYDSKKDNNFILVKKSVLKKERKNVQKAFVKKVKKCSDKKCVKSVESSEKTLKTSHNDKNKQEV
jgi:hypothetical protein